MPVPGLVSSAAELPGGAVVPPLEDFVLLLLLPQAASTTNKPMTKTRLVRIFSPLATQCRNLKP
jgi:hypothetical protein